MSVGPQLQLAVLWPWLLMAMLQIRLGYSGLALVAAMEAERTLAQKAIIRVIPFKLEPLTLEGVFASIAEITPAEGKLLQPDPPCFLLPLTRRREPAKSPSPPPRGRDHDSCLGLGNKSANQRLRLECRQLSEAASEALLAAPAGCGESCRRGPAGKPRWTRASPASPDKGPRCEGLTFKPTELERTEQVSFASHVVEIHEGRRPPHRRERVFRGRFLSPRFTRPGQLA
ncbi:E3 ubiquitin-protein ligase RNF43 [Crotalus adamanteus]|uniref:E3 ubiquitin-protein ligase RNF43 n=1 Tax=Crotalus adamanteus TaxID=8729 RepID=A0AAW1CDC4_CROAD